MPRVKVAGSRQQIKSVKKAIAILRVLAESRNPLAIGELAAKLRMTPSTVSRMVATLVEEGLVEQERETGRCYLGLGLHILGNAALGKRELDRASYPWMLDLAERFNETVNLSKLHHGRVVYLRGTTSEELLRAEVQLGAVLPVHCTAPGKVLVAWRPEDEVVGILKVRGMERYTPNTITTVGAFLRELEEIRRTGIAYDNEELSVGLKGVGAPIRDHTGQVVAALSIGAPAYRLAGEKLVAVEEALREAADAISRTMGYLSQDPFDA